MKVKVFKDSIYEIEDIINEWFKNNVNISIINIKSVIYCFLFNSYDPKNNLSLNFILLW